MSLITAKKIKKEITYFKWQINGNETFTEEMTLFTLTGKGVTYAFAALESGHLAHIYYGKRADDEDLSYLLRLDENPFTPKVNSRDMGTFMDTTPFEYPVHGTGDYREPAIMLMDNKGMSSLDLRYVSYEITKGKPILEQSLEDMTVRLPATFAEENEAETIAITLEDKRTGLNVILYYTVFADLDVITRSVKLINKGAEAFDVRRVLSACVDFDSDKYDFITLNGSWARERVMERCRLHHGKQSIDSVKGESSHQNNPFAALVSHTADEDMGEAYGFNLVYSGNFFAQAEVTQHKKTRFVMGINPFDFSWKLEPSAEFTSPELVMVYSAEGIGKMS
ncbi:MAG: glycoside hydrolase family 36 N-terminal domain-containing protein, partial [Huintestinicola sp.]